MDCRLLYPSAFLSSADLGGKDVTLTIRRVDVEELKTERGPEKKPVMRFEETKAKAEATSTKEKGLVLPKVNAMTIASMYGNEVDGWVGKRVTLYPTRVQAFGKEVDAIRIRPEVPAPAKQSAPAALPGGVG
jgi:hypothetical protein